MRRLPFVVVALTIAIAPSHASASSFTWEFLGTVTEPHFSIPSLSLGTPVRFSATFDTGAPDLCSQPGRGFYQLPGGTVTIGASTYTAQFNALEVNNPAGNCASPGPLGGPQSLSLRFVDFDSPDFFAATIGWTGPETGEGIPTTTPSGASFFFGFTCAVCSDARGAIS